MRISDWSSDVCSSDLRLRLTFLHQCLRQSAPLIAAPRRQGSGNRISAHRDGLDSSGSSVETRRGCRLQDPSMLDECVARQIMMMVRRFVHGQHRRKACVIRFQQPRPLVARLGQQAGADRSEEHTSELQSLMRISYAVFCMKKKKKLTHDTS